MPRWKMLIAPTFLGAMSSALSAGPLLPFTGPAGRYYLDGTDTIYVVKGTQIVQQIPKAYGGGNSEGVLAVSDTIRTRHSVYKAC